MLCDVVGKLGSRVVGGNATEYIHIIQSHRNLSDTKIADITIPINPIKGPVIRLTQVLKPVTLSITIACVKVGYSETSLSRHRKCILQTFYMLVCPIVELLASNIKRGSYGR